MNGLRVAFLKIAALFSFCGGPLLVSERLKPHFGSQIAFLVTFVPVGLMLFGALFLEDDIGDRVARVAVWSGRQALYVVVAMHAYAVWCFAHGLRVPEQYRLSKLGITLRDLAQFLESQPHMFAVFTNDEVARVAGMARHAAPSRRQHGQ